MRRRTNRNWGGAALHNQKLYKVWYSMIVRCQNVKHKAYPRYGGRGITVCAKWQDFRQFLSWASASGYQDGLSIDRINNDGTYAPRNCRWATLREQNRNKRTNARVEYLGRLVCYGELAEMSGLRDCIIRNRIVNCGWDVHRAVTTPVMR